MTNLFSKKSALSVCFVLSTIGLYAQSTSAKYEIGIQAGLYIYQGDLTPTNFGSFKTPTFHFGINGSRYLTSKLSVRLDLSRGSLKGDESRYGTPAWRQQRNFAFKSSITEVLGLLVYHPIGRDARVSPYLFAGLGYAFLNIKRDYSRYNAAYFDGEESSNAGLNADIAHGLPRALPVLPVGVGIRYRVTDRLSLNTEGSYRVMSTDYLDGFSQSANPNKKDHYYKYSVGLSYSLGGKDKYGCPVVKY